MNQEKYRIISEISMDHVKSFHETIFKQPIYIQTLVQGNMTSQEAIDIFNATANTFNATHTGSSFQIPEVRINQIPNGKNVVIRVDGFGPKDKNTIVSNYYQYGPGTLKEKLLLEIGCQIMKEPAFEILRIKEQLGYHMYSCLSITNGILGATIYINTQVSHNLRILF